MKICFIAPCDLSVESGGRTHTLELVKQWARRGHEVFLFSQGLEKNHFQQRGIVYREVPVLPLKHNIKELSFSFFATFLLFFSLRKEQYDVVFIRSSVIDLPVLLGGTVQTPFILQLNDVPFSSVLNREFSLTASRIKKTLILLISPIFFLIEMLIINICREIVITTQTVKTTKHFPYIRHKSHFVSFGADTNIFFPTGGDDCRNQIGLTKENPVICFVGSFLPWQGLETILLSLPFVLVEYPDTKLLLVGGKDNNQPASHEERLFEMIRDQGLTHSVILPGHIEYNQVPTYINASDICIVAQRATRGGFTPLKLFEYMACGKPVIGTNIDGVREVITECNCGLIFEPDDKQDLANKILCLLKNNQFALQLGCNGRNCTHNKYNWGETALSILNVLQKASDN